MASTSDFFYLWPKETFNFDKNRFPSFVFAFLSFVIPGETLTCTWLPLPLGGMGYRCIPDWDPVFKTYVAAEQAGILDAPSKPTPKPSPKQCASLAEDCKETECCK